MARPGRSADKRERLLQLGVQRLRAGGYHGTGIQQLVQEAGVPKGSFYNYFASKEDFGAAVVRAYAQAFRDELDPLLAESEAAPRASLRRFFDNLIERFRENGARGGCLVGNLGAELEGAEPELSVALKETMGDWREAFGAVVARAQAAGEIGDSIDSRVLADFVINAWEGALIRMKIEHSVEPLERCIEILFDGLLRD
jgi:TetR/AcrR family transcriptional regulator, transcriptional repressor for nem operon